MKYFKFIVSLIFIITSLIFLYLINDLNILPNKYLTLIIIVVILIDLIILIIYKNKFIIGFILSIIFSFLYLFLIYNIYNTSDFLKKIINNSESDYYYVIVLKESIYNTINDLENKRIGLFTNEDSRYNEALEKVNNEVNFENTNFDNIDKIYNSIINKEVDAILLSDRDKEYIRENNSDFDTTFKVIYEVSLENVIEDISKDVEVTIEPFNIYISGIDTYGEINKKSRSDVNIIVTVNPKTKKILLTHIPRDYYVILAGKNSKDKLTHSGVYGINTSVMTIEELLDIDINYYVRVNFDTLITLVDLIDGIDVYSDLDFISWTDSSCHFIKGINHMNGKEALAFSRERKIYQTGDRHRGENQEAVISAIIEKMTSNFTYLGKYQSILNTLEKSFQTNMNSDEITNLIKFQIDTKANWNIQSINLDGTGKYDYTYTYGSTKLYVMEPDIKTIENFKIKYNEIIN